MKIADEMDLSWTVKLQPDEFFTPEDSSARLVEAIEHIRHLLRDAPAVRVQEVASQFSDFAEQLDSFKARYSADHEEL